MRDELSDDQWIAIKPMLLNKPRGVPDRAKTESPLGEHCFGSIVLPVVLPRWWRLTDELGHVLTNRNWMRGA